MAFTFDGPTKRINLTLGTTTLDVRDLWSRWCDWFQTSDNSKYLPTLDSLGGDHIDISAGTLVPVYAFLLNSWKIKPQETSHTLNVTNGILLVSGGGDPFVNTTGSYIVRINYQQPVQAISFDTGGGGGATASELWNHVLEGGYTGADFMRVMVSVLAGKVSGADTNAPIFRDLSDTKARVTAVTDASGNRTSVTVDGV